MSTGELFERYTSWLQRHVPAAFANLGPPAGDEELSALERHIGHSLPAAVRATLRMHNGQRLTLLCNNAVRATPCLPTLSLLSTRDIAAVWSEWDRLRRETAAPELAELHAACSTFPGARGKVKALYSSPGWIPLWADPTRPDYIGLDLDTDVDGAPGQIINFGRNEDRHFIGATDYDELLAILLEEVESGGWPASEIKFGDEPMPWFGSPKGSFFNALYKRFAARHPKRAKVAPP